MLRSVQSIQNPVLEMELKPKLMKRLKTPLTRDLAMFPSFFKANSSSLGDQLRRFDEDTKASLTPANSVSRTLQTKKCSFH